MIESLSIVVHAFVNRVSISFFKLFIAYGFLISSKSCYTGDQEIIHAVKN